METTTPMGLKKPGGSDFISPQPFNDNAGILNALFPIGTIYESTRPTDPGTFRGGTWTRKTGVFLFAADTERPAGTTGGEVDHLMTINEMPFHEHPGGNFAVSLGGDQSGTAVGPTAGHNLSVKGQGGNQPHNNMPPFEAIYVWERTA